VDRGILMVIKVGRGGGLPLVAQRPETKMSLGVAGSILEMMKGTKKKQLPTCIACMFKELFLINYSGSQKYSIIGLKYGYVTTGHNHIYHRAKGRYMKGNNRPRH
jgi:hypothetical protein